MATKTTNTTKAITAKATSAKATKAKAGQNDAILSNGVKLTASSLNKYAELFGISVERFFLDGNVNTAKAAFDSACMPQVVIDTFDSIAFSLHTSMCEMAKLHTSFVNGVFVGDESALNEVKNKVFQDVKIMFSFNENMKVYESLPTELMYICWSLVNDESIEVVEGREGLDALKVVYNGRVKSTRGLTAFKNRLFSEMCWRHMRLEMVSDAERSALNERIKAVRDANTAKKKLATVTKETRSLSALRKKCDTNTDVEIVAFLDNEIARLKKDAEKAENRLNMAIQSIDMLK